MGRRIFLALAVPLALGLGIAVGAFVPWVQSVHPAQYSESSSGDRWRIIPLRVADSNDPQAIMLDADTGQTWVLRNGKWLLELHP